MRFIEMPKAPRRVLPEQGLKNAGAGWRRSTTTGNEDADPHGGARRAAALPYRLRGSKGR